MTWISHAKTATRLLLPPIIYEAARRLRPAEWEYVAGDWPKNDPRSEGWQHPSIGEALRKTWRPYLRRVAGTGPLGLGIQSPGLRDESMHNVVTTYAYVLARAAYGQTRLSLLDWGGAAGHYAVLAKAVLPEVALDYTVKEQPGLCALGRELLPEVTFCSSDEECFSRRYDLVMAASSLQYEPDWKSLAGRLANAAGKWLFVTRLPTVRRAPSFVVVQRPFLYGYRTEYLSWVFNRQEFLSQVLKLGLAIEREFMAGYPVRYRRGPEESRSVGFLFRTGSNRSA